MFAALYNAYICVQGFKEIGPQAIIQPYTPASALSTTSDHSTPSCASMAVMTLLTPIRITVILYLTSQNEKLSLQGVPHIDPFKCNYFPSVSTIFFKKYLLSLITSFFPFFPPRT